MDEPTQDSATLARIVAALADRNHAAVARKTGIHENTIRSIARGVNKNPSFVTIEKLTAYLFGEG